MAQIKQVGIGRKSVGTIDGITYYVRGEVTYVRFAPNMPASVYNNPAEKLRQAIFKLVQMHARYHLRTIRQTFTQKGNGSTSYRYFSINDKALSKAMAEMAEQYCAGEDVYLTGHWPETITLNALTGDSTVIIIVNKYGQQTTHNADGIISTGTHTGGDSYGSSSGGTNSGETRCTESTQMTTSAEAGVKTNNPWWVIVLKVLAYLIGLLLGGIVTTSCAGLIF